METDTSQVASFYDQHPDLEHARLEDNPIEYAVTWHIIEQTIQAIRLDEHQPLRILDIGGGTGRYSVRLAKLGHHVTLTDISSKELDLAKEYAMEERVSIKQIVQADARRVNEHAEIYHSDYYDLILCLGPFYHLLDHAEREKLVVDLTAMLKPSSYLLAAFVTIYAHLRDVATKDPQRLLQQSGFYADYIETGQYTKTMPMHHTNAAQIRSLFSQLPDVTIERLAGTEAFLAGRMATNLKTLSAKDFDAWAELAIRFSEDPEAAGGADHILVVAKKVTSS